MTIGCLNLDFRGNVEAGHRNLTIIGVSMVFSVKGLDHQRLNVERKEGEAPRRSPRARHCLEVKKVRRNQQRRTKGRLMGT